MLIVKLHFPFMIPFSPSSSIINSNTSLLTATKESHRTLFLIDCCVIFNASITSGRHFEGCNHPKCHRIPVNLMAEAIRNIFGAQNKQKRCNGSDPHPPFATPYSLMHSSAAAKDLRGIFVRKPIKSLRKSSTAAIDNILSTR